MPATFLQSRDSGGQVKKGGPILKLLTGEHEYDLRYYDSHFSHTGGEQHETDKEPGYALAGHLAHRLGLDCINPGSQWPEPDLGDTRHCGGCFDPAGSVGCSGPAVLVCDWTGPLHSAHERRNVSHLELYPGQITENGFMMTPNRR